MSEVENAQNIEQTETVQAETVQTEPTVEAAKEEAVQTEVAEAAKDDNSVFLEELEKTFKKTKKRHFNFSVQLFGKAI